MRKEGVYSKQEQNVMPSVLTLEKPDGEAVMEGPMLLADPAAVGLPPGDDSVPAQFIKMRQKTPVACPCG